MARAVELSGVTIVGAGALNPAIFQPEWFVNKNLLDEGTTDAAHEQLLATPQMTVFVADWISVQVTLQQIVLSTVEEGREVDLRDLAKSVLDLLPETPLDAIGINADAHFRVESEDDWHAIGDRFLPKDFWEPLFSGDRWKRRSTGEAVGLHTLAVIAARDDVPGAIRIEVAPSTRVKPNGVYTGINAHFELTHSPEKRGNGYEAARLLDEHWDSTRELERELIDKLVEAA